MGRTGLPRPGAVTLGVTLCPAVLAWASQHESALVHVCLQWSGWAGAWHAEQLLCPQGDCTPSAASGLLSQACHPWDLRSAQWKLENTVVLL